MMKNIMTVLATILGFYMILQALGHATEVPEKPILPVGKPLVVFRHKIPTDVPCRTAGRNCVEQRTLVYHRLRTKMSDGTVREYGTYTWAPESRVLVAAPRRFE